MYGKKTHHFHESKVANAQLDETKTVGVDVGPSHKTRTAVHSPGITPRVSSPAQSALCELVLGFPPVSFLEH